MLAYGLQPIVSFYLVIAISRILGVEGLGTYRTIFNYVAVFQISAAFGLRSLLTREIAQNKEGTHRYLVSGSVIAILFSMLSCVAMVLLVSLLSNNANVVEGTIYASLALIALGLADVYEGVIGGFERLSQVGFAWLAENVVRIAISLWLIYSGFGVLSLVWVYIATRSLKTLYYAYFVKKKFAKPYGKIDWQFTRDLARQAKTFALITICVTIYWKADVIMIEAMRSEEEVGFYSAAYSFLMISLVFVDSFVNSIYPVLANFFKSAASHFEAACRKSLKLLVMATVPISVGFSLAAKDIIALIYEAEFLPSVAVLQLLIWTLVPYAVSQIFAYALVASNKQKIDLLVNAVSMVANISLNLLLIPKYGYMGATYATLISIHIYVGVQIPFIFPKILKFDIKALINAISRVAGAALTMAFTIIVFSEMNVIVKLLVSGSVYLVCLFLYKVISESDKFLIRKIFRRAN
jgi:O-antigen/teichoic acid export membrane protein